MASEERRKGGERKRKKEVRNFGEQTKNEFDS
jgi:hypothetical protein